MEHMKLFSTIKGTACNKDRARVWVESSKLGEFGFTRHTPIMVRFECDGIVITVDPAGTRKVAGRERNGKAISILDICMPMQQRADMFCGAEKLCVFIDQDIIVIRGAV